MRRVTSDEGRDGPLVRLRASRGAGPVLGTLGALLLALASGHAFAQDRPAPAANSSSPRNAALADGKTLYEHRCSMCHSARGMGTVLLSRTRPVALLEARDDLAVPYVVLAARQGLGNMPAIPRGELSDDQLSAIAGYLAAGPHEPAQ